MIWHTQDLEILPHLSCSAGAKKMGACFDRDTRQPESKRLVIAYGFVDILSGRSWLE